MWIERNISSNRCSMFCGLWYETQYIHVGVNDLLDKSDLKSCVQEYSVRFPFSYTNVGSTSFSPNVWRNNSESHSDVCVSRACSIESNTIPHTYCTCGHSELFKCRTQYRTCRHRKIFPNRVFVCVTVLSGCLRENEHNHLGCSCVHTSQSKRYHTVVAECWRMDSTQNHGQSFSIQRRIDRRKKIYRRFSSIGVSCVCARKCLNFDFHAKHTVLDFKNK